METAKQQPYWANYRDLVFAPNRDEAAIERYFASEGSLLIYGDTPGKNRQGMLQELELSLTIRQQLEKQGRLFFTEFDFEALTRAISLEISRRTDYSSVSAKWLDAVKILNETLQSPEIHELFKGFGIMTIVTGARIPTVESQSQQFVNAIFAHPDDAEIAMFFRLLWEMVMNHAILQYFCMFPGSGGGNDRGYTMLGAKYVRTFNELVVTARMLGVPFVHLLAFPDKDTLGNRKFGAEEWMHFLKVVRAAEALGVALARVLPGNLWIGHSGKRSIDWHPDHSFMGLLIQWLTSFGQWVSYYDAVPDSRPLTMPSDFAWAEAVIWEAAEKLGVNDQTGYNMKSPQGGNSLLVQFLLQVLSGHKSQNGLNYGEVKILKEGAFGMDSINDHPLKSLEKLLVHAGSDNRYSPGSRFIDHESPIFRFVMMRMQWLAQFSGNRLALLMAEEPDFLSMI